ncbi:MAG: SpoVR family protein, partial [Halobacteriales archaeon]|nr:SpoVR family protein [Halobacteriales archaeon]
LAEKLGLDGYEVNYWIVDYDEMNELIAYDGFQTRYPHWRWGMKYDRQQKQDRHGMGRAFEIVINDDPAHAYLQESNAAADQKAVITHVEAHADFFKHNRWYRLFGETVDAAAMFERHGRRIREYMEDPEIGRETVEHFIDSVLAVEDTIDQHRPFEVEPRVTEPVEPETADLLADLDLSEDVKREVFDEEWLERVEADRATPEDGKRDVLAYLRRHGKQFDADHGKAVPMADWKLDVLDMLRAEAYYLAPQRMTKICNEGWAAYWESIMMGEEAFAEDDEFLHYADHQARVLGSPGLNPYKLGKQLWEYIENRTNREEVVDKLLRVEGVTWQNFHDVVDFRALQRLLEPPVPLDSITPETLSDLADIDEAYVDQEALHRAMEGEIAIGRYPWKVLTYEGLARRHYSLIKPQFRGTLRDISRETLDRIARYQFDDDLYPTVEAAIDAVDFTAG